MCSLHYSKSPELWRYKRPHSPLQGNNTCRVEETQWISACSFLLISAWEGDGEGLRACFLHRTKTIIITKKNSCLPNLQTLGNPESETSFLVNFPTDTALAAVLRYPSSVVSSAAYFKKPCRKVVQPSPILCTGGVGAVCPCSTPGTLADLCSGTGLAHELHKAFEFLQPWQTGRSAVFWDRFKLHCHRGILQDGYKATYGTHRDRKCVISVKLLNKPSCLTQLKCRSI